MQDKCTECERDMINKVAELEMENEKLKRYNKIYEQCLDVKDELCKALREDNEVLRNKLRVYGTVRKERFYGL